MWPFGQTVLAWRLARGLTQDALARAAGISRPNLCAIERGRREVTLGTLRALAVALDTTPGTLADGIPPESGDEPLSRAELERVAESAVTGAPLAERRLAELAEDLREAAPDRLAAGVRPARKRRSRRADRAWLLLKARQSPATLASLLERMTGWANRR